MRKLNFLKMYFFSHSELEIRKYEKLNYISREKKILIQCVHEIEYFDFLYKNIKKGFISPVYGLYPLLTFFDSKDFIPFRYFVKKTHHYLIRLKWKKLYNILVFTKIYSPDTNKYFKKIYFLFTALIIFLKIKKKEDLLNLTIDSVYCGDLIYDTYLRFNSKSTVNVKDPTLIFTIYSAIKSIYTHKLILKNNLIETYYTTHTTYITHGIPCRVFLLNKINVVILYYFDPKKISLKQLSTNDTTQVKPYWAYRDIFSELQNKKKLIEKGVSALYNRFLGNNDLTYMKENAFKFNNIKFQNDLDGVVFLHDFFDSPHIYKKMVFVDFYEWLIFTIEIVLANNLKVGFKPHPNQISKSKVIIDKVKFTYPEIIWIDEKVSNKDIFDSNITFGISVYGTVLSELAFAGKVAICCGENPASTYSFINEAKTKKEYEELITNAKNLKQNKINYDEIGEYYYMNYLYSFNCILK